MDLTQNKKNNQAFSRLSVGLILLMSLFLANCESSNSLKSKKENKTHKKTFKTPLVRANFKFHTGGLGGSMPILYQVRAVCKDTDCKSPNIVLSFSLEAGSNDVYLNNFSLIIHADNKDYRWEKPERRDIRTSHPIIGRFLSVNLTKSQLKHIAQSNQVKGNLAGNSFQWSLKNRKPLRTLMEKLK
jgi:hypothetical protein